MSITPLAPDSAETFGFVAFGKFVYQHAFIRNAIPDKKYLELLDKKKKTL